MAEFNFCAGEVDVAGEDPKVAGIDGIGDLLTAVSIAPRFSHGLGDFFGGNEVLLHQGEFFTGIVGQQVVHRFLDLLLFKTERGGTISLRVQIVQRTREDHRVINGASPRASQALFKTGRAAAAVAGRNYVIPDDIKGIALQIISHRIDMNRLEGFLHGNHLLR